MSVYYISFSNLIPPENTDMMQYNTNISLIYILGIYNKTQTIVASIYIITLIVDHITISQTKG